MKEQKPHVSGEGAIGAIPPAQINEKRTITGYELEEIAKRHMDLPLLDYIHACQEDIKKLLSRPRS